MKKIIIINILIVTTSCSYISGPEGMFPPTKNAFVKEKVEEDMQLPDDLNLIVIENHIQLMLSMIYLMIKRFLDQDKSLHPLEIVQFN